MKNRQNRRGVTLMELMIVMVIIGILVGLLVPVTIRIQKNAAETKVRSGMIALRTGIMNFYTEYGIYPLGDPVSGGTFSSREVIAQLRPNGFNNTRRKLLWEGPDEITMLDGREWQVVIVPTNPVPIRDNTETNKGYSVYFKAP